MFSNYLKEKIIKHFFNIQSFSSPSNIYVGLFVGSPVNSGVEASYTNYSRMPVTFSAANNGSISQSSTIKFPLSGNAQSGTLTHYGLYDAETGGNLMSYGELDPQLNIVKDNMPRILGGSISVSISSSSSAGFSKLYINKILDFIFRKQSLSAPSLYLGLSSTDIDPSSNTFTELQCSGYNRKALTGMQYSSLGKVSNSAEVDFFSPTENDSTEIKSLIILDAQTSGNIILFDNSVPDQIPHKGDEVVIEAGKITYTLN